jgi:hypothetical protein
MLVEGITTAKYGTIKGYSTYSEKFCLVQTLGGELVYLPEEALELAEYGFNSKKMTLNQKKLYEQLRFGGIDAPQQKMLDQLLYDILNKGGEKK